MNTDTSWIVVGAAIVVLRDSNQGTRLVGTSTVESVARLSFKVKGVDQRFKLATLRTSDSGDTWNRRVYRVLPPDSEQHLRLKAEMHILAADSAALLGVDNWRRERRDFDRITAAIDALQALRDALSGGVS